MIREAQKSDLTRLDELYRQLNEENPSINTEQGRLVFDAIDATEGLHLFVLEDDAGEVQATCYLNIIPNLSRCATPYGLIENVVTEEPLRGQGFGKQIMEHALEFAWAQGCYKVMLLTGSDRVATREFYRACGFDGERKFGFDARPAG